MSSQSQSGSGRQQSAAAAAEAAAAAAAAAAARRALGENEWACPDAKCAHVNTAHCTHCSICGKARPRAKATAGQTIGKDLAEKSKGLFAADDWACQKCGNINWARRNTCNMCNAPKAGELEARTGYGGGYMDRQVVEYRESRDSDDEYDEFGRIKKKKRGQKLDESRGAESDRLPQESKMPAAEPTRPPDGATAVVAAVEKDVHVKAVDEQGEDGEEEDESGSDADLSKYDLTEFDNIGNIAAKAKQHKPDGELDENGQGNQSPVYSDCSCTCSGGSCSCSPPPSSPEPDARDKQREKRPLRSRERRSRSGSRGRKTSSHRRHSRSKSRSRSRSRDKDRDRDRFTKSGKTKYRSRREDIGWMLV